MGWEKSWDSKQSKITRRKGQTTMYTSKNYQTKKALKEAVNDGQIVRVYQPNNMFGTPDPKEGKVCLEGPHYPQPHKWYASGVLKDGILVKVS